MIKCLHISKEKRVKFGIWGSFIFSPWARFLLNWMVREHHYWLELETDDLTGGFTASRWPFRAGRSWVSAISHTALLRTQFSWLQDPAPLCTLSGQTSENTVSPPHYSPERTPFVETKQGSEIKHTLYFQICRPFENPGIEQPHLHHHHRLTAFAQRVL